MSAAFLARPVAGATPQAGDDAAEVEWVGDWRRVELAFDHARVLRDAEGMGGRGVEPAGPVSVV